MPRKRRDPDEIELIPQDEFEDVMRAVLKAPRDKVNARLTQMQVANKTTRVAKKKAT